MNQLVKKFNNFIKKTIFNVQNKTNNKFKISSFNKILITFIGILFLYIFYLLIPLLYGKDWVQSSIESKILNEFKINISTSTDISYRILPSPHFLIKDSKILLDNTKSQKSIADVRSLKVFFSQKNFFNKKKMNIKKVTINYANFSILRNDFKILNDFANNKFSNKKIKINKSNIFLKDNFGETVTIIKVDKATLFFDDKKLQNKFDLIGNVFAIPFTFKLKSKNNLFIEKIFSFKAKSLNLGIFNNHITKQDNSTAGKNIISFLNSKIDTEYKLIDGKITFTSINSKINNFKINYDGKLAINPFDLDLHIDLDHNKITKLLNLNSVLIELLKSGLLFNENISLNTSITVNSNRRESFFDDAKIYLNILNGKINFDGTKLINKNIGSLRLNNSSLFLQNNKLTLSTNLFFDIKDSDRLFSFLNTNKTLRKEINNILVNIDYDFMKNDIKFNKIKINNKEPSNQFMNIIDGFNNNDSNNLIKTRRLLNELLSVYKG